MEDCSTDEISQRCNDLGRQRGQFWFESRVAWTALLLEELVFPQCRMYCTVAVLGTSFSFSPISLVGTVKTCFTRLNVLLFFRVFNLLVLKLVMMMILRLREDVSRGRSR